MLEFFKNIINIKLTWKLRIKYFYFFAKINALAHFTYVEKRREVCFSLKSTFYGWVWVVGYLLLFIYYCFRFNNFPNERSLILFFVVSVDILIAILKALLIYVLQIIHAKDLVLLINDAINIQEVINYEYREDVTLYGQHFERLYNFRKWWLMLQIVLMFWSCYNNVSHNNIFTTFGIINASLIIYAHFSTVLSGLYIYGSLLFGYAFYYSVNRRLNYILTKIKLYDKSSSQMEIYCQACDELDKISLIYSRINAYVARINRIFAIQILIELLGSFSIIICAVSISPCNNCEVPSLICLLHLHSSCQMFQAFGSGVQTLHSSK